MSSLLSRVQLAKGIIQLTNKIYTKSYDYSKIGRGNFIVSLQAVLPRLQVHFSDKDNDPMVNGHSNYSHDL